MAEIDQIDIIISELERKYPEKVDLPVLLVDVSNQQLTVWRNGHKVTVYPVSTATQGTGNRAGSHQTPVGAHYIRRKIGFGQPSGTIFKARQNTHKTTSIIKQAVSTGDDYITSRILWLSGLEKGTNRGGNVDTFRRYIYIHGTHEEGLLGQPASHGCIRMANADVISLFKHVPEKSLVYISDDLTNSK